MTVAHPVSVTMPAQQIEGPYKETRLHLADEPPPSRSVTMIANPSLVRPLLTGRPLTRPNRTRPLPRPQP